MVLANVGDWMSWSVWGPAGFVIGIIALLLAIILWFVRPPKDKIKERLTSSFEVDRLWVRDRVGNRSWFESYKLAVGDLNGKLEGLFGSVRGYRSFELCLRFAFLYPIALFILSWLVTGVGKIGELEILPSKDDYRLVTHLYLSTVFLFSLFLWRSLNRISQFFLAVIKRVYRTTRNVYFVELATITKCMAIVVATACVFILAFSVKIGGTFASAFAGAVAGAGTLPAIIIFSVAITTAYINPNHAPLALIIVFYLILPILNAILDWLS